MATGNDKYKNCDDVLNFKVAQQKKSIIKVIGVGGGGGNAVNHMYDQGIHDVSFAVCNTDAQALNDSPVPYRLQLGHEGLGAGNKPECAAAAAEETIEDIKKMLDDGTKMVFITAGMGGGTGTGAAPIIAREAKAMNILTVGIVTIPFLFEGKPKIYQALDGVSKMAKNVDALLIINNERLRNIYPELTVNDAFAKADDTLSIAARSISDIITYHGKINLDFNDVRTVMKNGGVAIMSTAYGEGEHRVTEAIDNALLSPLLNNNEIFRSKKILFNISSGGETEGDALRMDEMNEVHDFMSKFSTNIELKWGLATDAALGNKVKITILATGFGVKDVTEDDREIDDEVSSPPDNPEIDFDGFYPQKDGAKPFPKKYYIYTFNNDTLDDEDVISSVQTKPTYKRNIETLRSIQGKAKNLKGSTAGAEKAADADSANTIVF